MQNHWAGYLNAVGGAAVPASSLTAPYLTSDSSKGTSGFLDLVVKKPDVQAKYDAMSGSWAGVQASEAAVKSGIFKAESMPLDQIIPKYK